MQNEVVRINGAEKIITPSLWRSHSKQRPTEQERSSVVVLHPNSVTAHASPSTSARILACLEAENSQLRDQAVELALLIQELAAGCAH